MPYEWRTRPGLVRSRAFAAIPAPLILALSLFVFAGWRWMRSDLASAGAMSQPAEATTTTTSASEQGTSVADSTTSEISGLRQEVADLDAEIQQQTLVSMAKNDQVQTLQSELMDAQRKLIAASADRDEAVRQASELRDRLQANAKDLDAVCRVLGAEGKSTSQRGKSDGALAICRTATLK